MVAVLRPLLLIGRCSDCEVEKGVNVAEIEFRMASEVTIDCSIEEGEITETEESGSSSGTDFAPKIRAQMQNLSTVLADTNENLLSFEFMLDHYRKLAKIQPIVASKDQEGSVNAPLLDASQLEQTEKLNHLLQDLNQAVQKISDLSKVESDTTNQGVIEKEVIELEKRCRILEDTNDSLKARNDILEQECANKARLCDQLTESAHRSRAALEEERSKCVQLDKKLERERRAAQKVGQDVTRYVEQMQALEAEVKALRVQKKSTTTTTKVEMSGDSLTAVTVAEDDLSRLQDQLEAERKRSRDLEAKIHRYEDQIRDNGVQMADLKKGLEAVQQELEEKYEMIATAAQPSPKKVESNSQSLAISTSKDQGTTAIRAKFKALHKRYIQRKKECEEQKKQLDEVRVALQQLNIDFLSAEENFHVILSHLGSQIEISAKVMATYLNVDISAMKTVQVRPAKLSKWFGYIHSLSTWLQGQIVSFGKRYWTKKEPPVQVLDFPLNLDDLSKAASEETLEELSSMMMSVSKRSIVDAVVKQDKLSTKRTAAICY